MAVLAFSGNVFHPAAVFYLVRLFGDCVFASE